MHQRDDSVPRQGRQHRTPLWKALACPVAICISGILLAWGWSVLEFGTVSFGLAYLNGYSVCPESAEASAGKVGAGNVAVVVFRLKNLVNSPVTVVGAKADCGCLATDNLPLTISPKGISEITLRFAARRNETGTHIRHGALLFLDVDQPPIYLTATAEVIPPEQVASVGSE